MSNTNTAASTTTIYPIQFLRDACTRLNSRNNTAYPADYRLIAEGALFCDDRDFWTPWPH